MANRHPFLKMLPESHEKQLNRIKITSMGFDVEERVIDQVIEEFEGDMVKIVAYLLDQREFL